MEARRYQLDLADYVMERNAIIYLPTGAGKTYLAIIVLKRLAYQTVKTIEEGGKRTIFMCNTVELARQQALEIRKTTSLRVGFYVGDRNVDTWSPERWKTEINNNQVLVGTSQVFLDLLTHGLLKITDLNLVIMDECHHATKSHPMHEYMRFFQLADNPNLLPRVLGLTGVLLKGSKVKCVSRELENLEATYRGNIITVTNIDEFCNVMLYSTKPKEYFVPFPTSTYRFSLYDYITNEVNITMEAIDGWDIGTVQPKFSKNLGAVREPSKKNFIKNLLKDFLYQMNDLGLYGACIAIMSPIIEFHIKKRQSETWKLRQVYRYVITKCEAIRHMLVTLLQTDTGDHDHGVRDIDINTLNSIYNFSTPKVLNLLRYLQKTFAGKSSKDIRCLIFVDRRYTAKCLYYVVKFFVKLIPELKDVLTPQFVVGRNTINSGMEYMLERTWSKNVVDDFRKGKTNLIICSNVLEEGIDVQACNYVLVFDQLKTFNSYIQIKGRARSKDASFVIFTPDEKQFEIACQINKYKMIHSEIQQYLKSRVLDRNDPHEDEIAEQFLDFIEPFRVASGACLVASMAIQLLTKYCQLLPQDSFTHALPKFSRVKSSDKYLNGLVSLELPMQSTVIETIFSDKRANVREMKISAAFKALKQLYYNGELNEKLLPISRAECVQRVSDQFFKLWEKYKDNVMSRPGKQKRRTYERYSPDEFYNSMPIVGEICYAYEIKIQPCFNENPYNEHIKQLLEMETNYGILLRKRLPSLADMPLYMNQGELKVSISDKPIECKIENANDLKKLKKFHLMIFRDILNIMKSFLVMNNGSNKKNSFLLVPLKQREINWSLVSGFQRLTTCHSLSVSEREQHIFRPEDYVGCVVNKWYSGIEAERYVVVKVRTDKTPLSLFENDKYESYAEFVESKYGNIIEKVVQKNQFLLEVKQLTSRRNFFVNAIGKTNVEKDVRQIILLPELCHNYKYPSDMWLKALIIPSVLHRLHFLLHAEKIRKDLNTFFKFDVPNYKPKPLEVDISLRRATDSSGNAVEEIERPKKSLSTLPTKSFEKKHDVHGILGKSDMQWKEHFVPEDFSRRMTEVYPVEIDYYYKFITGLSNELHTTQYESDNIWDESQYTMPPLSNEFLVEGRQTQLSIDDTPIEEKCKIEILERTLGRTPITSAEQFEILAALTTAAANDVFDMERYELLGDSFLKFSVSLYLINKFPNWHEGFLTEVKSRIVSNQNLLYCLLETDIPNRICASLFNPTTDWLPPLISLPGNIAEAIAREPSITENVAPKHLYPLELTEAEIESGVCTQEHFDEFVSNCKQKNEYSFDDSVSDNGICPLVHEEMIADKVIADTLEALIGVCVKNYGIHRTFSILEYFHILKAHPPNESLTNLLNFKYTGKNLRTNLSVKEIDQYLVNHEQLEKNLGYKFRDRAYLLQALTHPSYPTNRLTGCYQQLEFIGDAILDFLTSCYIFERFKNLKPGKLTDLRASLVNNLTLACVCVRFRFHHFLLYENSLLQETIKNFADFQATQKYHVTDDVRILMEESIRYEADDSNGKQSKKLINISDMIDVPKVLGDIVEAIIAAVYLDSRDLEQTWNVIYNLLQQEIHEFSIEVPIDPVRKLYEHKYASPSFSEPIVDNDVVMITCCFTCLDKKIEVNGFGNNSAHAKKCAAKHALQILAKNSN